MSDTSHPSSGSSLPAPRGEAVARAAEILGGARQAAIAGLGTDVAGLRAALALARRIGAVIDHAAYAHERVALRSLSDAGLMATTAAEARHRADLVVLAGPGAVAWTDRISLFETRDGELYGWRGPRSLLCLATGGRRPSRLAVDGEIAAFGDDMAVDRALSLLSARLAGRPVARRSDLPDLAVVDAVAALLAAAHFGVAVVDPADFDHVAFERLTALVHTLNGGGRRFSELIVPAHHHGRGANHVALWIAGSRLPLGFGRGCAEQDDWRFDIERAVEAGEVDALLWIGALGPDLPAYAAGVPTVALLRHGADARAAEVAIEVGVPGITHAGVLADAARDGFAFLPARAPQPLPPVAEVLAAIAAALPEAPPC